MLQFLIGISCRTFSFGFSFEESNELFTDSSAAKYSANNTNRSWKVAIRCFGWGTRTGLWVTCWHWKELRSCWQVNRSAGSYLSTSICQLCTTGIRNSAGQKLSLTGIWKLVSNFFCSCKKCEDLKPNETIFDLLEAKSLPFNPF